MLKELLIIASKSGMFISFNCQRKGYQAHKRNYVDGSILIQKLAYSISCPKLLMVIPHLLKAAQPCLYFLKANTHPRNQIYDE
jgi:hypothetical protein